MYGFSSELIFHPRWAPPPTFPIPLSSPTTHQLPNPETFLSILSLITPQPFNCQILFYLPNAIHLFLSSAIVTSSVWVTITSHLDHRVA